MLEFILARYNYWIVIILMMTGLYIVFSRGNLVKTVVGLNIFQTSVFIFYITIGKVMGGTAPILIGSYSAGGHGEGYGAEGHGDGHGDDAHDEGHGDDHASDATDEEAIQIVREGEEDASLSVNDPGTALDQDEAMAYVTGERANELGVNEPGQAANSDLPETSLHDMSELTAVNTLDPQPERPAEEPDPEITLSTGGTAETADGAHGAEAAYGGAEAAGGVADVLYSNPLPHVLILTAIVVGVATTAVGLAIAVRIREAYGTIEEDALERMDNEAATGSAVGERAPS